MNANAVGHTGRSALLGALIGLLAACSGTPTDPEPGDTTTSEAQIGPEGGAVRVTAPGGANVTLTFPPGAMRAIERVTLTALDPRAETWVRTSVEPAGLALFEPVTIEIEVPEGFDVPAGSALHFGSVPPVFLRTTWDAGTRVLAGRSSMLGFSDPGGTRSPAGGSSAVVLAASPATCAALLDAAEEAFNLFHDQSNYTNALAYYEAYQSLAANAECTVDTLAWMQTARVIACDAYAEALENAQVTATDGYGALFGIVEPLVYWGAAAASHGTSCFDEATWVSQIESEFQQFMLFYGPELEAVSAGDFTSYKELREEAHRLIEVWIEAQTLGLDELAQELASTMIAPFLLNLREVAYNKCHEDGDHYFLTKLIQSEFFGPADVLPTGRTARAVLFPFADQDIQQDLQYCGSRLTLTSIASDIEDRASAPPRSASGGVVIGTVKLGGLGAPGQSTSEGELLFDPLGYLVLSGEIRRLVCFPPSQNAGDHLSITLDSEEIATVPSTENPDLMSSDLSLDLAAIFAGLGETPGTGDTYTLRIWRQRTDCSSLIFGPPDFLLFEVVLTATESLGELVMEIEAPESIRVGEPATLLVRAGHRDAAGNPVWEAGLDVAISEVLCGSASTPAGQTGAGGTFATSLSILDDPGCEEMDLRIRVTDVAGQSTSRSIEIPLLLPDALTIIRRVVELEATVAGTYRYFGSDRVHTALSERFFESYDAMNPVVVDETVERSADSDLMVASGMAMVSHSSSGSTDGLNSLTAEVSTETSGSGSLTSVDTGKVEYWSMSSYAGTEYEIEFTISGSPFSFTLTGDAGPGVRIRLGDLAIEDGELVSDGGYLDDDAAAGFAPGPFHLEGTIRHDPSEIEEIYFWVDVISGVDWHQPETSGSGSHGADATVSLTMSR